LGQIRESLTYFSPSSSSVLISHRDIQTDALQQPRSASEGYRISHFILFVTDFSGEFEVNKDEADIEALGFSLFVRNGRK
jgi:hypothetical protein